MERLRENRAAEIKIRAQRRGGEILAEMERAQFDQRSKNERSIPMTGQNDPKPPTLAEMDITKTESSTWQAIASIPEEKQSKRKNVLEGLLSPYTGNHK